MGRRGQTGTRRAEKVAKRRRRREREAAPLSVDEARAEYARLAADLDADDPMRALVLAAAEVGYLVTDENEDQFSDAEVDAFVEAAQRHGAELEGDASVELFETVRDEARDAVSRTLESADPDVAREFDARLADADEEVADDDGDGEAGEPGTAMALLALLGWLRAARGPLRERRDDVVAWVEDRLGADASARRAGAVLDVVIDEQTDRLDALMSEDLADTELVPVLVWLAAATVAVLGGADVAWLATLENEPPEPDA